MQLDFHYYATYCAAYLAGYSHEEALDIGYSAQFVDCCSRTLLSKVNGPKEAATTQLQIEMMEMRTDLIGLMDITRIWSSFHFLPKDLNASVKSRSKAYRDKYRLICGPNGDLVEDMVKAAKNKSLQAVGIAMHVLADTWAHQYFAGTPSYVINNTNYHFYEIIQDAEGNEVSKRIRFAHNPTVKDDIQNGYYVATLSRMEENTVMNLGHGRAGHFPDYSFAKYRYLPAWADYEEYTKDNPSDYYQAFCQMVYAMEYLRGKREEFRKETYAAETVAPWEETIKSILTIRQINACKEWKALGEQLSGSVIPDFDVDHYQSAYTDAAAEDKEDTFLGRFFSAAVAHKGMVVNKIFRSGNILAGVSIDYKKRMKLGFRGYRKLWKEVKDNRGGKEV